MKKLLFVIFITLFFVACGAVYNSQLKQVELGMTRQEIVNLMGDKYESKDVQRVGANQYETLEYKDRYKYHWLFTFENNELIKWWKERE